MKTLLACLITTMLLGGIAYGLTFEGSGVPYETLETENFIVRYEPGDGQAALDVSKALEDGYGKITRDLGLKPKGKTVVELYITPRLYQRYRKPAPWAIGGRVYPERNMMALPSPSTWGEANIHRYEDLWHVMRHEYTHVILRGATKSRVPMWLDEGLAVYEAGQWNTGYQRLLRVGLEGDELLSIRELEDFDAFIAGGALSYAESYSAVLYIKTAYGDEGFKNLLRGLARGMSFEDALRDVAGVSWDEFEDGWRHYLEGMMLETQAEAPLNILGDAEPSHVSSPTILGAEDETPLRDASEKVESGAYAGGEALPPPRLIAINSAALASIAVFVRILKSLMGKAPSLAI